MASINYSEVVTDLRGRAARLTEIAESLAAFMGKGEVEAAVIPASILKPKKSKPAVEPKEKIVRSPSLVSYRQAALGALGEGAKTPRQLAIRILELRPESELREVSKTAWALRQAGLIKKSGTGAWELVDQKKPTAAPVEATSIPPVAAAKRESTSDIIRRVAAEAIERTSTEITDQVLVIDPRATRDLVSTTISQLISKGELRKTDQLKVRPVVNGRILSGEPRRNGAHA